MHSLAPLSLSLSLLAPISQSDPSLPPCSLPLRSHNIHIAANSSPSVAAAAAFPAEQCFENTRGRDTTCVSQKIRAEYVCNEQRQGSIACNGDGIHLACWGGLSSRASKLNRDGRKQEENRSERERNGNGNGPPSFLLSTNGTSYVPSDSDCEMLLSYHKFKMPTKQRAGIVSNTHILLGMHILSRSHRSNTLNKAAWFSFLYLERHPVASAIFMQLVIHTQVCHAKQQTRGTGIRKE